MLNYEFLKFSSDFLVLRWSVLVKIRSFIILGETLSGLTKFILNSLVHLKLISFIPYIKE